MQLGEDLLFEAGVAEVAKRAEHVRVWLLDDNLVLLQLPSSNFLLGEKIKYHYCLSP